MHRHVISVRALTEVSEVNETQVFTVNKKLVSMRPSYMIKDVEGRLLGRTNRKILTLFRPKLWLEDSEGRKLLEAKGNFLGKMHSKNLSPLLNMNFCAFNLCLKAEEGNSNQRIVKISCANSVFWFFANTLDVYCRLSAGTCL
jgi:hypothetical protein